MKIRSGKEPVCQVCSRRAGTLALLDIRLSSTNAESGARVHIEIERELCDGAGDSLDEGIESSWVALQTDSDQTTGEVNRRIVFASGVMVVGRCGELLNLRNIMRIAVYAGLLTHLGDVRLQVVPVPLGISADSGHLVEIILRGAVVDLIVCRDISSGSVWSNRWSNYSWWYCLRGQNLAGS